MTVKYSILTGMVLIIGVSVASAAPVELSSSQMDAVSAGRAIIASATASATGRNTIAVAQAGTASAGNSLGSVQLGASAAGASGTSGAGAGTAVATTGNSGFGIHISNTSSSQFGTLAVSFTAVASN